MNISQCILTISISRFELGSATIAHMVTGTTNQFSTQTRLEEVKEKDIFF
jgi:hypothetical protein